MVRPDYGWDPPQILGCRSMNPAMWTYRACVVLALLTAGLAISVGRTLDDFMHPTVLAERGILSMYDFLGPAEVPRHRFLGQLPWWTSDDLSMRFFRPLSSLDLAVDHLWLDRGGWLSHLHGLLWHVALLLVAHRVFSLLLDRRTADFSTALYALAGWHTMPLAFVAARHAVLTAVFALFSFAVLLTTTARAEPGARGRPGWSTALTFVVALLAGESGLLVVPLMLGWAVTQLGVRAALVRLAPTLCVGAIYALGYAALGLGARGSSLYLDPLSTRFLAELPFRWLALNADLFGGLAADATLLGARPVQVVWGALALAMAALAWRWLYARAAARARMLLGLVCGAMVSCVLASAAMPGGRTLVVIGIAASASFGSVLHELTAASSTARRRWLLSWVLVCGIGLHPLFRVVLSLDLRRLGTSVTELAEDLSQDCTGRVVMAVGAMDMNVSYVGYAIEEQGLTTPRALHVVSMGSGEHTLSRRGPGEYELSIAGDFLDSPWALNHTQHPPQPGSSWSLSDLDLQLLQREPETVLSLSLPPDAEVCWLTSTERGLAVVPFDGQSLSWTPSAPR